MKTKSHMKWGHPSISPLKSFLYFFQPIQISINKLVLQAIEQPNPLSKPKVIRPDAIVSFNLQV